MTKLFRGIDLMAMRDHFSPSFLSQLFNCSMKAVLGGVLKLDAPREQASPALLKGQIIHRILEHYFLILKRNDLSRNSTDMLTDCFDKTLREYEGKMKFYEAKTLADAIKYFRNNAQLIKVLAEFLDMKYMSLIRTRDTPIQTELVFKRVSICGYNFDGRIDLWFGNKLTDFKSIGQGHSKDPVKSLQESAKVRREFMMQMLIYKHGIDHAPIPEGEIRPPVPEEFSIMEVLLTKSPTITEYNFTAKEVEDAAEELTNRVSLAKEILSKKMISRNYRTVGCPCEYSNYCLDEENLKMVLSKTNTPIDFF